MDWMTAKLIKRLSLGSLNLEKFSEGLQSSNLKNYSSKSKKRLRQLIKGPVR